MSYTNIEDQRAAQRKWYHLHKAKVKTAVAQRRRDKSKWFVDLKKDLKCSRCGNDDYRVLDFHHRDKGNKRSEVSTMVRSMLSNRTILIEIEKCDVLCANCHRIEHWEESKMPL